MKQTRKTKGYYSNKLKQLTISGDQQQQLQQQKQQYRMKSIRKQPMQVARQARQRKKRYIQVLQNQVNRLQQQNKKLTLNNSQLQILLLQFKGAKQKQKQQQQSTNNIMNNKTQNNNNNNENRFQQLIEQMKRLYINLKNNSKSQITRNLSFLRDNYGISGKQRLKQIDNLFDRIVELLMPMHFRILIENAPNNRNFLSEIGGQRTITPKFNQSHKNTLIMMRPQFLQQKKQYSKILENINNIKQHMKYQNWICQGLIDNIQQKMDVNFIGNLLIKLDGQRQNYIYPCNYWEELKGKYMTISYPMMMGNCNINNINNNNSNGVEHQYNNNNVHIINNNQNDRDHSFNFQRDSIIFDQLFM